MPDEDHIEAVAAAVAALNTATERAHAAGLQVEVEVFDRWSSARSKPPLVRGRAVRQQD